MRNNVDLDHKAMSLEMVSLEMYRLVRNQSNNEITLAMTKELSSEYFVVNLKNLIDYPFIVNDRTMAEKIAKNELRARAALILQVKDESLREIGVWKRMMNFFAIRKEMRAIDELVRIIVKL